MQNMSMNKILSLISFLILLTTTHIHSHVILSLEGYTFCAGTSKNRIDCELQNQDHGIHSIQFDLLFDTNCFNVTKIGRSGWVSYTNDMDWYHIANGIHVSLADQQRHPQPLGGDILYINTDVQTDCPAGTHFWEIANLMIIDTTGADVPSIVMDELVTTTVCSTCVLQLSRDEYHMGEACISVGRKEYLTMRNIGVEPADITIECYGCADISKKNFIIKPTYYEWYLRVICHPQSEDLCEGSLVINSCGVETVIEVSCFGTEIETPSIFLSDETTFSIAEQSVVNLMVRNCNDDIAALQVDVLYDTNVFHTEMVNKTFRSSVLDIFNYSHIEGGIRIALTGLGHSMSAGTGPAAEIVYSSDHALEGEYIWEATSSIAADPLGTPITLEEGSGTITVLYSQRGDVDNNGLFNVIDVFWALRIVLDEIDDPSPRMLEAADCNDDGIIDVTDVIGIVNIVLGLDTCPP